MKDLSSYPPLENLQNKVNYFVPSTSRNGCQEQGVSMLWKDNKCKTIKKCAMMINKYARMVETMMDDIFGFCIVNARCKSVFGFLDF